MEASMQPAIAADGLCKSFRVPERAPGWTGLLRTLVAPRYRQIPAVEDLSFRIAPGERVAFVGPNGAGKSTTIKMLCGILRPCSGRLEVGGHVPWQDRRALGHRIGTVFGQRSQLWYHLPAADSFELLSHVYGLEPAIYRARLAELVEAFALGPLLDRPVRQLSLGERMRCEIVASLLHAPDVLFLDEPTIGLDVTAKAVIRERVREAADRKGCAVLLTSHDTVDIEQVCERVLVIHHGRLLIDARVGELRRGYLAHKRVTLTSVEPELHLPLPGVERIASEPHRTVLRVDPARTPVGTVLREALARSELRDVSVEDPPLEDVIREIYAAAPARETAS
jgi:ABC-2 type transport system ATP-binding protein